MPVSYLTSLPAELRNRIYELCTPVYGEVVEFEGLRKASKQIQVEFEAEAVKAMRGFLHSVVKNWPHPQKLRIEQPRKFSELGHVAVQLPVSLYYPPYDDEVLDDWFANSRGDDKELESNLAPLFSLHLSSLVITFYDDSDGLTRFHRHLLPEGLLRDLTNVLVKEPTRPMAAGSGQSREFEQRTGRKFRLVGDMNVRRLCFQWGRSDQSSEHVGNVQSTHIKHFLREQWWWSGPMANTLVTNWGRGDDYVFFDIDRVAATTKTTKEE